MDHNEGEFLKLAARAPGDADDKLLSSFCPTPMVGTLNDAIQQRHQGTNLWPFQDVFISTWIQGSVDTAFRVPESDEPVLGVRKLWLYGHPGCGRTVLTASIVENLIRQLAPQHAVGYYFCNKLRYETTKPTNVLRTLVAQLAQQSEDAFQALRKYLQDKGVQVGSGPAGVSSFDSLSMEELGDILKSVSRPFERVWLVVNAGVETLTPPEESALVRMLSSMTDSAQSNLWVLFGSIDDSAGSDLAPELGFHAECAQGRVEDIRLYVQAQIFNRINQGDSFLHPESTKAGIEDYITKHSNGAWNWAICELDNQCELARRGSWQPPASTYTPDSSENNSLYGPSPGREGWRAAVLPYGPYLDRILSRNDPRQTFILERILRWIWVGMRTPELQLSIAETNDFLSILLSHYKVDNSQSDVPVGTEEIEQVGGQFIRRPPGHDIFEFRHDTVEPYLMFAVAEDKPQFKLEGRVVYSDVIDELDIVSRQLEEQGRLAEAEALMRRLLPCRGRLWGPTGNPILAAYNNLSNFCDRHGRLDEAEELLERALEGYRKAESPNKESMLNTINNLAISYKGKGRLREAEELYNEAYAGRKELVGSDGEPTLRSMHGLGLLYATEKRYKEAAPLWEQYLQGLEKLLGPDHPDTMTAACDLGKLYKNDDRDEDAIPLLERALENYKRTRGVEVPATLDVMGDLATVYSISGRYGEAEPLFKHTISGWDKILGPENDSTVPVKDNLGVLYLRQKRRAEAVSVYKELLETYKKLRGPDHISVGETYSLLEDLYESLGELEEAEEMASQALIILDEKLGAEALETVQMAHTLGLLYAKQNKPELTAPLWERSAEGYEKIHGTDDTTTLGELHNLGRIYKMVSRLGDAEDMLETCFERCMATLGTDESLTQRVATDLVSLYEDQDQPSKLQSVYERFESG
ncbi:hypothetical protein FQN54_008742 [Arachnomyces sp. PD_36]|nr:hypothetical protein FQN54_008742 [Arachnomyces sp. PD_36]